MLIGITGKSCAGKDFISAILKEYGYCELNLDTMGHAALQHKQDQVFQAFPKLKNAQKTIDRKKLGDLVFRNPAALHK
ncbi:MAG: dephospho-CoA kinase, partial [Spirochaetota bacterium]